MDGRAERSHILQVFFKMIYFNLQQRKESLICSSLNKDILAKKISKEISCKHKSLFR